MPVEWGAADSRPAGHPRASTWVCAAKCGVGLASCSCQAACRGAAKRYAQPRAGLGWLAALAKLPVAVLPKVMQGSWMGRAGGASHVVWMLTPAWQAYSSVATAPARRRPSAD
jgi:hypothetical protein